jgi:AAA+ ATPase superfamily predicted ATPase
MKLLNNLRRLAHFYFLKKELKFHHVNRKVVNLYDAREIGILFDASDTDRTAIINTFADSLRKERKKITLLGYYNFPKPAINFNFPYFNRKNINWHYEPNGALVEEFVAKKFDILINAYIDENLALEYVSAMSQATFRIGHYDKDKIYSYDFMVDMKGQRDLRRLLEQLRYYMEMV